jgi:hypothetical protein
MSPSGYYILSNMDLSLSIGAADQDKKRKNKEERRRKAKEERKNKLKE